MNLISSFVSVNEVVCPLEMVAVFVSFVWCLTLASASFTSNEYTFPECPSISTVVFSSPFCQCRYGPAYDAATNTCPNPECPTKSIAEPSYPNCTCTEKNFSYSKELNECFRVCPENSSGYWPKCICDDKSASFVKNQFKCMNCPSDSNEDSIYPECNCDNVGEYNQYKNECIKCVEGSTGIYPNCTCNDENASYFIENQYFSECRTCPPDSSGKVPKCICDNGSSYNKYGNSCAQCPFNTIGDYPNCECSDDGYFDGEYCKYCPYDTNGTYPNCICDDDSYTFVEDKDQCFSCPIDSTGIYPFCECKEPLQYNKEANLCVQCPVNSAGMIPDCECKNGFYHNISNLCVECPPDSQGIYPNCECDDKMHTFSAYINECYIGCNGGIGKHPYCDCGIGMFYNTEEFKCESNIGRACPKQSIGTGPDCLCIEMNKTFIESLWSCLDHTVTFAFSSSTNCPDRSQKYPQCSGIDPNALKSLIG